jgi:glutaminyl-tRNA synthetase
MYDFAHGQSDSLEGITHSLCSLEYEDHRPLYEWFLQELEIYAPRQIEFARLYLTYTMMSKRKIGKLVDEGVVRGWDDPRLQTLCGLRRRGYTPEAILDFTRRIGVAKTNSLIEMGLLEACVRDDLNLRAPRVMAVLRPLHVVIENYPEGQVEQVEAINNPEDERMGTRTMPFSREIYVEQDDFREDPPKGWFRLAPGREVRLKHAYYIKVQDVIKDAAGQVVELRCIYDPQSRSGVTPDGRKVQGALHWVSAPHAVNAEVRLYDTLFTAPNPDDVPEGQDWRSVVNPHSEEIVTGCKVEPGLAGAAPGSRYQFLRQGYFCVDKDSAAGRLIFNRTVTLKDTWAKMEKKG